MAGGTRAHKQGEGERSVQLRGVCCIVLFSWFFGGQHHPKKCYYVMWKVQEILSGNLPTASQYGYIPKVCLYIVQEVGAYVSLCILYYVHSIQQIP